jgi:hypothetical protein
VIRVGQPALIPGERFVDEQGRAHYHDITLITACACSQGHAWLEQEGAQCWCGWVLHGILPRLLPDQQAMPAAPVTRSVAQWQRIATWCLGPGAASYRPEGEVIAVALRLRGACAPEHLLAIAGLSAATRSRILTAEQLTRGHAGQ